MRSVWWKLAPITFQCLRFVCSPSQLPANNRARSVVSGYSVPLFCAGLAIAQRGLAYEAQSDRHALIIGNSAYTLAPLENPTNDASDLARKFRKMKYNVTVVQDQGGDDLARTVETFYESVTGTDPITVFYYAGHAVQVDGVNYLLPVDKEIYTVEALVRNGYSLNRLLLAMKDAVSEQNVIILDACRNNPLEAEMLSSDGRGVQISAGNAATRQMAQQVRQELRAGLAQVKAPPGTLEHSSLLEPFYFRQPRNQGIPDIVTF
ncbi:MAG: hypothetical protein CNE99_01325 [OM182 bacterium MED-G24]|uniref:Caspase family p20 domain-containing protein n=1 Tax=OM182 bacterium MED-G24 TaxID=1986255 RepID=A0A2A5WZJ6_9GAMM|nr:MAG: hypothetical protein CNE99_01325 [OM182 bacterium MED-G24]